MTYKTIKVRFQAPVCFVKFNRPDANNTLNKQMVEEFHHVVDSCGEDVTVLVLEGSSEVFCLGADFNGMSVAISDGNKVENDPQLLYDLWLKLATGAFVTISHVRGKVNAGGVGFVAASDIVIADMTASFSLSELLFGLIPAAVYPFILRRTGYRGANYMALMTQPMSVQQAHNWGLVDVYDDQSQTLLRKHLLRLRRLPKEGISRYKSYINKLNDSLYQSRDLALATNREAFSNPQNIERILRFVENGQISSVV